MNKLIDKLFERDLVIKVISVMTAIFIWFMVLDSDNPYMEKSLSIPLSNNAEVLALNNLQIVGSALPSRVDIKIKGRKLKLADITENDFKNFLDLSELDTEGSHTLRIATPEYLGEESIIISSINPTSVTVKLDKIVGKQFPVNIVYEGELPTGYTLENVKIEPSNIILEDIQGYMEQIDKVVAKVNLSTLTDSRELMIRGSVLNAEGNTLRQFDGKVVAIVTFDMARSLPLTVTTKGSPATDWFIKELKIKNTNIRITGVKSVLDALSKLTVEPLDITGKAETYLEELKITLPKGASIFEEDKDNLIAEVVLEKFETREIAVAPSAITIYDGDTTGAKAYRVAQESISINVKGKPDAFAQLKASDIRLSASVSGLDAGEHEVTLAVSVPQGFTVVGQHTVKVVIDVSETPTPTATPTPMTTETSGEAG